MISVGEALARLETGAGTDAEALAQHAAWSAGFTCHDPSGAEAPCAGARDLTVPSPWKPSARICCPVASTVRCQPWALIKRADFHRQREEWLERCRRRGIPRRFADFQLRDVDETPAVRAVRAFLNDGARDGRALALLGPVGCGKTVAASAAVSAWPGSAFFLEADRLAQAAARDHERLSELVSRAEATELLALDDLFRGYAKAGGLAEAVVEEIVCHRHGEERATILSTNLDPAELRARLSPRLIDRLREWGTVVALDGPSLRRELASEE